MLQSFNDRVKGPFIWIVVVSISVIFVVSGMSFMFTGSGSESYIAKVGDNEISSREFQQYSQGAVTKQEKQQVLSQMIDKYLFLTDAQQHDITVPQLSLQGVIFNDPTFFENGEFSQDKLAQVAQYVGGMPQLEQMLSKNIKITFIPMAINSTSFTTNYDAKVFSRLSSLDKAIEYIKISPTSLASDINPTDSDLNAYYAQNKNLYVIPAKLDISYFVILKSDFKLKNKVSDTQIKSYYESNKDIFTKFDDKTKATIKKIIENRQALSQYNSYTQNIDSQKFNVVEKKLGKAKTDTVSHDAKSTVKDVKNSMFFANDDRYGSIAISDDETLVYQVNKTTKQSFKKFDNVKNVVKKAYISQKADELAAKKSSELLGGLNKSNKMKHDFETMDISTNDTSLDAGLVQYVLSNDNSQYHEYTSLSGDIYIYKINKVSLDDKASKAMPIEAKNALNQEEILYYLETIQKTTSVKVDYDNI